MKWAVAGLLILGLFAGVIAAALVMSVRIGPQIARHAETQPADVTIVALRGDLAAMQVIHADTLTARTVRAADAPAGALHSAEQAVGRMTVVPLVAGQVITENALVPSGSNVEFAALLPSGMRYMTISLSNEASQRGWIYPGCLVDVLAAFRLPSGAVGEALSTTLLRGVRVAAVDNHSLVRAAPDPVAAAASKGKAAAEEERAHNEHAATLVTLLVNAQQAEALKLAVDQGTIALALRNPTDENTSTTEGATVLQGGLLAQMAKSMRPAVGNGDAPVPPPPATTTPLVPPEMHAPPSPTARPPWQIQIFHGDKVETRTFDMPASSLLDGTSRARNTPS